MNTKRLVSASAFIAAGVFGSKALAAIAGREDNSSLVVWIFLGFCALIVIAQLLPLVLQLRIFARMQKEHTEESLDPSPVKVPGDE